MGNDKADSADDPRPLQDAEGDIPLAPEVPSPPIKPWWKPPGDDDDPWDDPEDRQFSMGELMILTAVVAVILSAISSIARWASLGTSPADLAKLFAAGLGFGALASAVALAFVPHARRIVLVGWWVLLGSYIVTAIAAVLMRK